MQTSSPDTARQVSTRTEESDVDIANMEAAEAQQREVRKLIRDGMSPSLARAEVLGEVWE